MPRPKKSDWQRKGLEIFETADLISDQALLWLLAQYRDGPRSQGTLDQLLLRLREIIGLLQASLHYRSRPTPGEQSTALSTLVDSVKATIAALETLDADTKRLLENTARHSPAKVYIDIDGQQVGYQVEAAGLNIHQVRSSLKVFEQWIESAKIKIEPSKALKKRKHYDERIAVQSLKELWADAAAGTRLDPDPKEAPFTAFVQGALAPVLEKYDVETSLTGIISEELYGKK